MEQPKKYKIEEWAGKRYGHLVIVGYEKCKFICKCDCGNTVGVKPSYLFYKKMSTCGKECPIHKEKNQGRAHRRLYHIWTSMKQRCYNKNHKRYYLYGGRGITICDEWLNNYDVFEEWALKNGYNDDLSIDRIDGNKGYYPENCRWATYQQQRDNAENPYTYMDKPKEKRYWGKRFEINGQIKSKTEWCNIYGLSTQFVDYRMKHGMTFEEAIKTTKQQGKSF